MAKRKEIVAVSYIDIDGKSILWDSLPEEKKVEYRQKMAENLAKAVCGHLRCHPEELASLEKYIVKEETP
ncbi:MAG: hypothetical protein K6G20_04220 [Ruminococcus sp.]|nr:hypothetical protein [Ruminococcus sp.]